jgi:hypothetical protein
MTIHERVLSGKNRHNGVLAIACESESKSVDDLRDERRGDSELASYMVFNNQDSVRFSGHSGIGPQVLVSCARTVFHGVDINHTFAKF